MTRRGKKKKQKKRGECKKICLEDRTGCVSFASRVFALACQCWGYKNLPDFGPNVPIEKATYLNGWCVGEWFSFGMPLLVPRTQSSLFRRRLTKLLGRQLSQVYNLSATYDSFHKFFSDSRVGNWLDLSLFCITVYLIGLPVKIKTVQVLNIYGWCVISLGTWTRKVT